MSNINNIESPFSNVKIKQYDRAAELRRLKYLVEIEHAVSEFKKVNIERLNIRFEV